jgi:PAS domain S-box-containing protein
MDSLSLSEYRCGCGKLLLKGIFFDGVLEIKCKKCGKINKIGKLKHKKDSSHYLIVLNEEGVIINSNDIVSLVLGYKKEELVGKKLTLINPTFPEEILDNFFGKDSVLTEENYFQIDTVHKTKEGENIPVTSNLKLFEPSEKEKYILIKVNKKNSEKENEFGSDKKFIKNFCDFYFDIDSSGVIEHISPSIEKIFGFSTKEVLGKKYFDFILNDKKLENTETFNYFSSRELPFRIFCNGLVKETEQKVSSELFFTLKINSNGSFNGYSVLGLKK